jgi:hypothetical protein
MNTTTATSERVRLDTLRGTLLRLHKALLESERNQYERAFGRIQSEFQLLYIAAEDPQFAWLRPLAELVVRIDERLAEDESVSTADVIQVGDEVRALVGPNPIGTEFQRLYHRAMQDDPNVVMAHSAMVRALPVVSPYQDAKDARAGIPEG